MAYSKSILSATLLVGVVLGVLGTHALSATGIQRVLLQRADVDSTGVPLEAVLGTAEIPAGLAAGRHTHPGLEVGYVLRGAARMEIDGQAPIDIKQGDSYVIGAGKVHDAKALGDGSTQVVACYVVEKGKPLSSPAP
jgi:quercetin dioxygenase-like cupin family protein